MARRIYALSSVAVVFGAVLAACVGDDPGSGSSTSSSGSGSTPNDAGPGGIACSAASPCAAGTCVDGFCCDSPCTGLCEACNVPGSEGKCSAVKGTPAHGKCDGDPSGVCAGSCDGSNRTACAYPEVECGKGSCAAGTATIAPKCKAGTCPTPSTQACALGCFQDGCLGVKHVAAGGYPGHACAAMTDGKVRCWGANSLGQVGVDPSTTELNQPTEVSGLSGVQMVAAVGGTSCALLSDGTVKCWGGNAVGQLGIGGAPDPNPHHIPVAVTGLSGVTFIAGGSGSSLCAIAGANAELKCWGTNYYGQLGNGSTTGASGFSTSPVAVCAPGQSTPACTKATGVKLVASGDRHVCAIFAGDQVACWGENDDGECGQTPSPSLQLYPVFVTGNFTATQLTAGNSVTCAASAGGAKCWGSNGTGRIGNCDTSSNGFFVPQSVGASADCTQLLSGVTAVSTHDESVCGISNGAVKCWGSNAGGQLGDGSSTKSQSYAATTAIAAGAVQVASGGGANYAIVVDGVNREVRCWGSEANAQCGTGTASMSRPTPVSPKW